MKRTLLISTLIAGTTLVGACSTFGARDGHGGHHAEFKAMREASIAACTGKAEGDKVTVKNMKGTDITALCMKSPRKDDGKLHAMPEQMVERFKAAQAACVGKSEGDAVQIKGKNNEDLNAKCVKHDEQLFAHPKFDKKHSPHGMGDMGKATPADAPKP